MTTRILGIVVVLACSVTGTAEATTNLKPFDPLALQGVAETTAKELLLPGAMVLLRTPQGDFAFGYGARTFVFLAKSDVKDNVGGPGIEDEISSHAVDDN